MKLARKIIFSIMESALSELEAEFKEASASEDYNTQYKFFKKAYDVFNKEVFKGELQTPSLEFKKALPIDRMKSVGLWYETLKTLKIDQRIFYLPWESFKEVMLHEMCHQAVGGKEKHGPIWKEKMKAIGLTPRLKINHTKSDYMAPSEKEKLKNLKTMMDTTKKLDNPQEGDFAKMLDKKGWVLGLFAGKFLGKAVLMIKGGKYVQAPLTSVYVPTEEEIAEIKKMNIKLEPINK